ncbi:MAG TPA: hypothetical protein DEG47_29345 [Cyanobacteria bacterium UBA11148]|nr:hypothetical protein [Cyanobacteria bacterium UBA11148]
MSLPGLLLVQLWLFPQLLWLAGGQSELVSVRFLLSGGQSGIVAVLVWLVLHSSSLLQLLSMRFQIAAAPGLLFSRPKTFARAKKW